MTRTPNAYALAGVDVEVEAAASRIMYEASKKTYINRKGKIGEMLLPFDSFSGVRGIDVGSLPPGSIMSMNFDGAGGKVEIPQRLGKLYTVGFDLVAMITDDAVIRGAEPVLIGSVLDLKSLGTDEHYLPVVEELARGYVAAAAAADVAIINGEIAQMGYRVQGYGDFPFNWSGACVWFAKKDRLFNPASLQPGDTIVAFKEPYFRCNGLSLVCDTFAKEYGALWHNENFAKRPSADRRKVTTLGEEVLRPSTIYTRFMNHLTGGFDRDPVCEILAAAHITGGGIPEKLGRMLLPSGLGACLSELFAPEQVVLHCQELSGVSDYEIYKILCMAHGMLVATRDPDTITALAPTFGIEASIVGMITRKPGIELYSRGFNTPGVKLSY